MSYDIKIWTVAEPDLSAILTTKGWVHDDSHAALERKTWMLSARTAGPVLLEDIPPQVHASLPGLRYVTEISLQPKGASASAQKELGAAATRIAKASHGVIVDPQTEEIISARGVKRYKPAPRAERFDVLDLGFWFEQDRLSGTEAARQFFDLLATWMPDALPRRYGTSEPPKFGSSKQGRDHLVEFFSEHVESSMVLYLHRPFLGLSLSYETQKKKHRLGYRSHKLTLECEAVVLEQEGWQEGLRRFWHALCQFLQPFYSEVRTLQGFKRRGSSYGSDYKSDVHPIKSWWWHGIPLELGHAVAVGDPYVELWPEIKKVGTAVDSLYLADVGLWQVGNNLPFQAPESIRQARTPRYYSPGRGWMIDYVEEYPEVFPFHD